MTFRPRRTEIVWQDDGLYGTVQFGLDDAPATDDFNRFGQGSSPLKQIGGPPTTPPPAGGGGGGGKGEASCPMIWEKFLSADTATSATLEDWTDLPGLAHTIAAPRNSIAVVTVRLQMSAANLSRVDGAELRARLLVNDAEVGGQAIWSVTDSFLQMPGKTNKAKGQLHLQTTIFVQPAKNYAIKVQVANYYAATDFTVTAGDSSLGDSNMIVMLFCTASSFLAIGGPKPSPADQALSWYKTLDFTYDQSTDSILVASIRGEFDGGLPPITGDGPFDFGGPWESTPDRAFLEVSRVPLATTNVPLSRFDSGTLVYKKQVADPSKWQDYYSLAFGADPSRGSFAWAFSADEAGPTAYSRKYYWIFATKSGQELKYESWNGPNWNDFQSLYGGVAWDVGTAFFLLIPTTDTTAASGGSPHKSGWRVVKKHANDLTLLPSQWGTTADEFDVLPAAGHDWRYPIGLVHDGGGVRFYYNEIDSSPVLDYIAYDSAETMDEGPSETIYDFGGYLPEQGQSIHWWSIATPNIYAFLRQGYNDVYKSSVSGVVTLVNNDFYQGFHDTAKMDVRRVADVATHFFLFVRGAQGKGGSAPDVWFLHPSNYYAKLAAPWLVKGAQE